MKILNLLKKYYFFYPFVFAFYPILSLFLANYGKVTLKDLILPFWFILLLLIGALLFSIVLTKNIEKYFISIFLFMVLINGYKMFYFCITFFFGSIEAAYQTIIWIFLITFFIQAIVYSHRKFNQLSKILCLVTYFMTILVLVPVVLKGATVHEGNFTFTGLTQQNLSNDNGEDGKLNNAEEKYDTYYIILDRYANQEILEREYAFDNTQFYEYLKNMGFCTVSNAHANYNRTAHSLASSLNYMYLDNLPFDLKKNSDNYGILFELIKNNRTVEFLKKNGYEYIHVGSWWNPTASSLRADRFFYYKMFPEFFNAYFNNSFVKQVFIVGGSYSANRINWVQNKRQIEYLKSVKKGEKPIFVFAHLLTIHEPYITKEDGAFMTFAERRTLGEKKAYIQQVENANKEILKFLQLLLSDEEGKSIVILQSDEGPHFTKSEKEMYEFNWFNASDRELKYKMLILNSYHLPDRKCENIITTGTTPVNSFRIIFNEYFGENFEYLENRSYVFKDSKNLYDFMEVTDRLK